MYKFVRKQWKSDCFPSLKRHISITSVLGKLIEQIILAMLEAYIEGNILPNKEQHMFTASDVQLMLFLNWCK